MSDPKQAPVVLTEDAFDRTQGGSDDGWCREVRVTPKPGTKSDEVSITTKKVEVELVWS